MGTGKGAPKTTPLAEELLTVWLIREGRSLVIKLPVGWPHIHTQMGSSNWTQGLSIKATMTRTRGEVMELGWRPEVGVESARGVGGRE